MSSIIIWNSCGIGGRDKKSCARSLVRKFNLDILGILETKLENIDDCTINSIWGRHSRDWFAVPSLGLSGGILCIWNTTSFCVSNCSVAMNGRILNIEGVLSRYNLECMVSLVYAPNDGLLKKEVWDYLVSFTNSISKPWCLAGDFNETLSPSDRKGSSKISSSMLSFKMCVDSCGLIELPLNGKKFTWSRGNAASRIDRMFVTGDWLQHLPSSTLYGLPKNFSDHRPLHMLVDSTNWGPKPVRMMNCWWLNSEFVKMVQLYWNTASNSSSGKRSMAVALKLLKDRCKNWSRDVVGNTSSKISSLEIEADILDSQRESRDLSADELRRSNIISANLRTLYRMQESAWHQKSRVQWCKLGDRNTRFFHLSATTRQKKNQIFSLDVDGATLTKPGDVKMVVFNFFSKLYSFTDRPRASCNNLNFLKLQPSSSTALELPFSADEVKTAVWDCEGNKAPGPDGINFFFIKKSWNIIGGDIVQMVDEFYRTNILPPGINSSFVTLIPKVKGANKLQDFRPISLVGSLYKIISKLLASRVKRVLPEVISDHQNAFIKGRQILDSVLIANEAINFMKKEKGKGYLFKLDFHKAFDSVLWDYVNEVMASMGFGSRWRGWIMQCISTAKMSVLVNGSPTKEFSLEKGLRQGDPLSPFLFNIAVQGLSCMLQRGCDLGLIEGVSIGQAGFHLSHLQFADDTLIFSSASLESMQNVKRILLCFELMSGLKVNFSKSSIFGVGIEDHVCDFTAQTLRCKQGHLPFKYLGLPIGANSCRLLMWNPIIQNISSRLVAWKGKLLSIGGRLCLIKSVLSNLPIYFLSLFPMPVAVSTAIEKKFRCFLWSGKEEGKSICNVGWPTVSMPKSAGGLGIGSLQNKNKALLFKWLWRYGSEESSMWKDVITSIYNPKYHSLIPQDHITGAGSTWSRLVNYCGKDSRLRNIVTNNTVMLVGNGKWIKFWLDDWTGNGRLAEKFPTLFQLSNDKDASLEKMGMWDGHAWCWVFSWIRDLRGRNTGLLTQMYAILSRMQLDKEAEDRLVWKANNTGRYSVKSLCGLLSPSSPLNTVFSFKGIWRGLVPPKVEVFCWMAIINKINTRSMLVKRGILDISAAICPICLAEEEMVDHLFIHCYKHWLIWSKIINWWGLAWCCPRNLANLFSQWDSLVYGKFQKKVWVMLFFSATWSMWLLRNDVIFKQKIPDYDTLFFLIVTRLCLWLKAIEPDFPYSSSDLLRSAEGLVRWTNSQKLRIGIMWSPPMTNRFKWNVDGSSIGKPGPSGIGGVLRNHHGILLGIFSMPIGILDSNVAELRAVVKAIELSASNCFLHHKHIIIESDSANVISWMNNSYNRPWIHHKLFSSAQRLASCFDSITYSHSYRESNHMADHLAKQGVHRISDFVAWL